MPLDEVSNRKLTFFIAKINDKTREKVNFYYPPSEFFSFFYLILQLLPDSRGSPTKYSLRNFQKVLADNNKKKCKFGAF